MLFFQIPFDHRLGAFTLNTFEIAGELQQGVAQIKNDAFDQ
jgi:hypothetical protein